MPQHWVCLPLPCNRLSNVVTPHSSSCSEDASSPCLSWKGEETPERFTEKARDEMCHELLTPFLHASCERTDPCAVKPINSVTSCSKVLTTYTRLCKKSHQTLISPPRWSDYAGEGKGEEGLTDLGFCKAAGDAGHGTLASLG